jgi:hypothetical protein
MRIDRADANELARRILQLDQVTRRVLLKAILKLIGENPQMPGADAMVDIGPESYRLQSI